MTETAQVIRINHTGPDDTGLTEWEPIDPAALVSGEPVQRGHIYHEDENAGFLAGVWDCTPMTEHMGPYPVDEFMLLVEGSLVMGLPDGTDITIGEGQAFVLPKGFECQWKQAGYIRKIFMIVDDAVPDKAANPSLQRITVPDLGGVTECEPSHAPVEMSRVDFTNAAGTMNVGLRQCDAVRVPVLPVPENRLIHVLAGKLRLICGETAQEFAPGETAYITQGSVVDWQTDAGTRLLQSGYAARQP